MAQATQNLPAIQEAPPRLPTIQAGGSVRAIVPQDFDSAWRIANVIVKSGMAPRGLDTPEKAMVAIMHGLEVGLTPMSAMQSIAVVNGRPTLWGDGALALVRGSGVLEWIEETLVGEGDDLTAVCRAKRSGEPHAIERTFSLRDASTAGLRSKDGPWKQYPKRMLQMRARAFALRDGFADVLKGTWIREEAEDVPMRDVTPRSDPPEPPEPQRIASPRTAPTEEAVTWEDAPAGENEAKSKTLSAEQIGDWLKGLDGAFGGAEDFATLAEEQERLMAPMKGKVPGPAWTQAEKLAKAHLERIEKAAEQENADEPELEYE